MSRMDDEYTLVSGVVMRTTEKAVLFQVERRAGVKEDIWIPRSLIEDGDDVVPFTTELSVKEWFVDQEGL